MIALGIDSGTQSTKTLALDLESGELLAESRGSYQLVGGLPPGHMEQHPGDWWQAFTRTMEDCLQQLGERRREVVGIGVSGQQHGLVVLDERDEVLRPAKLWCDTSTTQECQLFAEAFGGDEGLIALAGNPILPGYTAPKILWMKRQEPEVFARIASVLLPHDYLNFKLTGKKRMEYGDASGTGLLNLRSRRWQKELVDFIDPALGEALPSVGSSREALGLLSPDLAEGWGLSDSVVVSAGGGDNMMGAIGTGLVCQGVMTASLGTSGTLYGVSESPVIDPEGEVAAFCDSNDQWLPLVCTMNVTVTTEAMRSLFALSLPELEAAVSASPRGAEGLCLLPYLTGERTPNLPQGSGVLHGLTPANLTQENLARAAAEGATLGLAYGLNRFRALGVNPSEIRLTGGGSQSPAWRQICADAFGAEVVCLQTTEGAALGAAMQGGVAAGVGDLESFCERFVKPDEGTRTAPQEEGISFYHAQGERLHSLTQSLHRAGHL
ncbi:MAG: xylulokinase [Verrucomicrobiota bacterium]